MMHGVVEAEDMVAAEEFVVRPEAAARVVSTEDRRLAYCLQPPVPVSASVFEAAAEVVYLGP